MQQLLTVTKESLYIGIEQFCVGKRVGDVGHAIQQHVESYGYGVVRELVGHGLGKTMHEKPEMPNYGRRGSGKAFTEGMVVALEPMINMGIGSPDLFPSKSIIDVLKKILSNLDLVH